MNTRRRRLAPDAPELVGSAFVAKVRLTDKPGRVLAEVGERCDQVPPMSLPWLLEQGCIVPAPVHAEGGE